MILGLVSDAHGNPAGLEKCLRALQHERAERIFFLGDSVGYFPDEDAVLDLLASANATCIRGNHEEMLLGNLVPTAAQEKVYRLEAAKARISPRWREWIERWPLRLEPVLDGVRFLFVHGSPMDPVGGYVYPDTDLMSFHALPYDVVMMGQTHRPFVSVAGAVTVVNIGSCGMPRDVGNVASCALYDTASRRAEILRVEFDAAGVVEKLADRIDASVAACLQRKATGSLIGRMIDV